MGRIWRALTDFLSRLFEGPELRYTGPDPWPGWDLSLVGAEGRRRFLLGVLEAVPSGAVLEANGYVPDEYAEKVEAHLLYRGRNHIQMAVTPESLPDLSELIRTIDLTREWHHIEAFRDHECFLLCDDFMGCVLVSDIIGEEQMARWREEGVIGAYDWFYPGCPG